MDANSDNKLCPICANAMDWTDKQFKPCPCGYQICIWCWHHIMEEIEGHSKARCPACTVPYDKDNIPIATIGTKSSSGGNYKKKQKLKKQNQQQPEDRSYLSNYRLIRRDIVFLNGIPVSLANEKILQKRQFLGQYGKVLKAIPLKDSTMYQDSSSSSVCSIYVTFLREEDALRCILSVNGFILNGNPLRNLDCAYSHDYGRKEDICSKDDVVSACVSKVQECSGISLNSLPRRQGSCFPPPFDLNKGRSMNQPKPVFASTTSVKTSQSNEDSNSDVSDTHSCGSASKVASSTVRAPSTMCSVTSVTNLKSYNEDNDDFLAPAPCVSSGTSGTLRHSVVSRSTGSSCAISHSELQNQLPILNNVMDETPSLRSNHKKVVESTSTPALLSIKDTNEADTKVPNYVGNYTLFSNDDTMMETRKILQTLSNNCSSMTFDTIQDTHETSLAASCSNHDGPENPVFGYGSVCIDGNGHNLMENWQNRWTSSDPAVSEHESSLGTSYPVSYAPMDSVDRLVGKKNSNFHFAHTFASSQEDSYRSGLAGTSSNTGQLLETFQDRKLFPRESRHFVSMVNSGTYSENFEDLTGIHSYLGYDLMSSLELVSSTQKIRSDTSNMLDLKGFRLSQTAYGIQNLMESNNLNHFESFSGVLKDAMNDNCLADYTSLGCCDISAKQHMGDMLLPSHERKNSRSNLSSSCSHSYDRGPISPISVTDDVSKLTALLSSTRINCSLMDNPVKQLGTSTESRINLGKFQKDSTRTGLQSQVTCDNTSDISFSNAPKESYSSQNFLSASAPRPLKASKLPMPPGFTLPTVRLATQGFSNWTIAGE